MAREKSGNPALEMSDLRPDEDCLDTWFSSWLWPISLFNGILEPDNEEMRYYYPTSDLVTGPDIIFFWVARMIIAGYEFEGKKPFNNVYFTGIVRDSLGRKMSKSLGNSPDPLDLIDRFGADGVRMGLMMAAPAGNDILFDEKLCETGRNFCNKIWNAFRLVKGWQVSDAVTIDEASAEAIAWFEAKLAQTAAEVNDLMGKFRLSEALNLLYRLFWDEFSSWYLEMVKPAYGQAISAEVYRATLGFFDSLLRLLHPFMPFITEELWQNLDNRRPGESIMYAPLPEAHTIDTALLSAMEEAKEVITAVRAVRAKRNIPQKDALELRAIGHEGIASAGLRALVGKLANLSSIVASGEKDAAGASFLIGTAEYCVPLADNIDIEAERAKIEKDIAYYEGFLASVMKKLSNERFVSKAPAAVIEAERRKQSDAETKLATLRAALQSLN